MRYRSLVTFLAILGIAAVSLGAQIGKPIPAKETMQERIARATKLKPEDIDNVLRELGPVIRDELKNGKEVSLEGLGVFRVVRIPGHKDLKDGKVVDVPAFNAVEFMPVADLNEAANSDTAKPAITVPRFEYNPLPNQAPGFKNPGSRTPSIITRP